MELPLGYRDAGAFEATEDGVIRCEIADDAAILQKAVAHP